MDRPCEGREAAVGARYHALAPDDFGVAHQPLGDQLRMLDEVGRRVEHSGYDHAVVRQVDLADVLDIALAARPNAVSFEASNPRHAHEWRVFERVKVPDDKVIIPGVLDSTTNFIEHPDLVAERIARYARLVGRERVMAGTDCGFGTWVGQAAVDPDIAWAKLASMAEGARRATREFW